MPRRPAPPPVPPLEDHLFTPAELAARYGVTELTLKNWRWRGEGPKSVRIGRQPLYPASEVAAYEAARPRS